MRWKYNLERRYGRFAIANLTRTLVTVQVACLVIGLFDRGMIETIALRPTLVWNGEIWRVLTFLCVPPVGDPLWAIFYFYLFYMMGRALENLWGDFRYTLYLFIAYVANVSVALAGGVFLQNADIAISSAFLELSVFLAFAYLYPEFELMIMFILPVKVKWLALIAWVLTGVAFVSGLMNFGEGGWIISLTSIASVLNFLMFFGPEVYQKFYFAQRRTQWQAKSSRSSDQPRHKCTTCGITELTHPDEDFRYCTECEGTLCYCSQHIRNHEHVTAEKVESD